MGISPDVRRDYGAKWIIWRKRESENRERVYASPAAVSLRPTGNSWIYGNFLR